MDINILGPNIVKGHRENEFFTNCPFCIHKVGKVDEKHHLGFNVVKKVYQCLRCGTSGKLTDLKELALLSGSVSSTFQDIRNKIHKVFKRNKFNKIDLNEISWELTKDNTPFAYQYLTIRGFTDSEIKKYDIRVGIPYFDEEKQKEIRKWVGRILFPFYNNSNECVYVVGRTYNGGNPRYINSEGSKSSILYNINNVKDVVIICEGIISSISAERITGVSAVALLGKSITDYQVNLIKNKTNLVYLSLDADTTSEEKNKVISKLLAADIKVHLVDLPLITNERGKLKDPDDLKNVYMEFFEKARSETISRTTLKRLGRSVEEFLNPTAHPPPRFKL